MRESVKRSMPNGLVIVDNLLLIKFMMKMIMVPLGAIQHFQALHSRKKTTGLLQVDLEQTQRLVEREEGLSLAHKFNCSFYETSAAHRSPHLTDPHHSSTIFFTICASRRHVDDVFHTLVREIRKRDEEGEFKENETSRWKKVWNNIFKTIKRGRRKV